MNISTNMPDKAILQNTSRNLKGLNAFLLTPTGKDEAIDEARLCGLADEVIAGSADILTLFGSTGSIGSFTEDERKRAAEVLIKHVNGRVPVVIGTGAV